VRSQAREAEIGGYEAAVADRDLPQGQGVIRAQG